MSDTQEHNQPRDARIDIRVNKNLKQRVLLMLESISPKMTLSQYIVKFLTSHVEKHEDNKKDDGGK